MESEITPADGSTMETLQRLYKEYIDAMIERRKEASMGDYFSGWIAGSNRKDPLQDNFVSDIEKTLQEFLKTDPDSGQAVQILQYMYTVHLDMNMRHPAYLMMLAVQQYGDLLIPLLKKEDAVQILSLYEKALPKRDRLPVNVQTHKLLKKQAG